MKIGLGANQNILYYAYRILEKAIAGQYNKLTRNSSLS